MYRCESWTIKKAKHWRTDAFELWYWRRVLSPLDSKKIKSINPKRNQHWIFIGRTGAEAEAPIVRTVNAKSRLIGRPWCWQRLRTTGEGDNRGWDGWMASLTPWTWVWANSRRLWRTGKLVCCSPWGCKELVMTERLKNNNIDVYKWITWLCSRNWSIIFQFLKIN